MKPLRYYSDGSWGYEWDDEEKFQAGLEIVEEQQPDEYKEEFFERIGKRPKKRMYGSYWDSDELIHFRDEETHYNVACNGYGLDVLVNDESPRVRAAVADHGYGLDKLIDDESPLVRLEVANKGYGLDILKDDEDPTVRYAARNRLDPPRDQYERDKRYRAYLGSCWFH